MKLPPLLLSFLALGVSPAIGQNTTVQNITAQGILHDLTAALTCTACEAILLLLQALAHTGNDNFANTIADICILAHIEDDDVCRGALAEEGPILAHDLRVMTLGSHTSVTFCASLFGLCDYPAPRPYTLDFPQGSQPPANLVRPQSSGQPPLKVVQYSDIHVDLSYTPGANYNCTKPICCRSYTAADAPGNNSYPAGEFGNTNCDAPLSLEESMYDAISSIVPNASFVLFTGDVVEGAVWLVTEKENEGDIRDAYQNRMLPHFDLVYGTTGNHEAAPVNSFPPQNINTTLSSQWVYDTLSSVWQPWLGAGAAATASQYGAYATNHSSYLKIISINSNFYYNKNYWLFEPTMQYDPNGQLAWLITELQASEDAGQRVYILAHMPMGSSSALNDGSHYFNEIVTRYAATIAAMFFGHTHKDEFEISYSDYTNQDPNTATAMSYIAPAMTPTSGNPSFRIYDVDPVTFGILDYTEYFANLSSPNYQASPVWEPLYSAKEAYGSLLTPPVTDPAAELTPAFWHNVTSLFEQDDTVFQAYYARKTRGYKPASCDSSCKTAEICQLRAGEAQYNCVAVKPGFNFRKAKRDGDDVEGSKYGHDGDAECEPSVSADVFAAMIGDVKLLSHAVGMIKAVL